MKAILIAVLMLVYIPVKLYAIETDSTAKSHFYKAKEHLEAMLSGKVPISYERAIYEIENAWYGGQLSYPSFQKVLENHTVNILRLILANLDTTKLDPQRTLLQTKEEKIALYEKALTNYAIYQYLTQPTVHIRNRKLNYSKPYQYSTQDPLGTIDWTNTQVVHLINQRTGNCFAMASLFKIFSERLNSDAKICTAPGHIYIKHFDENGTTYNVELSSHSFPGSGTIETITYTSDDAVKSGIAMRELDIKQSIALCLVYLAKGYEYKLGINNNFMLSCAEQALHYDNYNLNAMLLKAELLEEKLISQKQDIEILKQQKEFREYEEWITHIYKLGYREMPYEMKNLLIKGWTKDTIISLSNIDKTPKRLRRSDLQDIRYAGLSWGLFDEEIRTKPIERYRNTVYDTKNNKITAFVKNDILYNQYNFDPVVFAWNIDPLAHEFPHQSPYSSFGNNPIYNIDVDGAYQYPAKDAAGYNQRYPMITKYLAENVQYDIKKSNIIQNAVTKNTYGGYTKQDLIWKVAAWGDKRSPEIKFTDGLAESTGAYGHTNNSKQFEIDAGFADAVEKVLATSTDFKEKQAALTSFFSTLLDETTHTGDLIDGSQSAPEVGKDATLEIFFGEQVKTEHGTIMVHQLEDDDPTNKSDFSGTRKMVDRKISTGKSEVVPTLPKNH